MSRRVNLILAAVLATIMLTVPVVAQASGGLITISSVSGNAAAPGTVKGRLFIEKVSKGKSYQLWTAFEALPDSHGAPERLYNGVYVFTFTNCNHGTAVDSVQTITSTRTDPYEGPAPGLLNPPTWIPSSDQMWCDYSLTFFGPRPPGIITGFQLRVFLMQGSYYYQSWSATWP